MRFGVRTCGGGPARKGFSSLLTVFTLLMLAVPATVEGEDIVYFTSEGLRNHNRGTATRKSLTRSPANNGQNISLFKDSKGVPVLTNRPDKYRDRADYVEIEIDYEPITVPQMYKGFRSATDYSARSIADLVSRYCRHYRLDEGLVYAVIKAESNFQVNALSPAGACGLMQLMPATAAEMGVTDIWHPAQNIAGGTQYLSKMLGLFDNNVELALAAYNAGPEAVKKHNGIPPYKETREYVKRVKKYARRYGNDDSRPDYALALGDTGPRNRKPTAVYTVHFRSGLTQPADEVHEEGSYVYIRFKTRRFRVRKALVTEVVKKA